MPDKLHRMFLSSYLTIKWTLFIHASPTTQRNIGETGISSTIRDEIPKLQTFLKAARTSADDQTLFTHSSLMPSLNFLPLVPMCAFTKTIINFIIYQNFDLCTLCSVLYCSSHLNTASDLLLTTSIPFFKSSIPFFRLQFLKHPFFTVTTHCIYLSRNFRSYNQARGLLPDFSVPSCTKPKMRKPACPDHRTRMTHCLMLKENLDWHTKAMMPSNAEL